MSQITDVIRWWFKAVLVTCQEPRGPQSCEPAFVGHCPGVMWGLSSTPVASVGGKLGGGGAERATGVKGSCCKFAWALEYFKDVFRSFHITLLTSAAFTHKCYLIKRMFIRIHAVAQSILACVILRYFQLFPQSPFFLCHFGCFFRLLDCFVFVSWLLNPVGCILRKNIKIR